MKGSLLSWPRLGRHCVGMLFATFPPFQIISIRAIKTHGSDAVCLYFYVAETPDNSLFKRFMEA